MFRHRKDDGARRYQIRQRLVSIGDDYGIRDAQGEEAYRVDGKALRVRETLLLRDPSGAELLKVQSRKLRIRDTMAIEDPGGDTVATVKHKLISPIRHRFEIDLSQGHDWEAHGNFLDHEYDIRRGHDVVARISKKWFRVSDVYGVEVEPGVDVPLVLAVVIVIDEMTSPDK